MEEGQRIYRKKIERKPADSNHEQSTSEATASTQWQREDETIRRATTETILEKIKTKHNRIVNKLTMSAKLLQAEITQNNESNNYATDVLGKKGLSLKKRRKK